MEKKKSPELDKRKKSPVPYKKKPKNKVNSEEYHRKRVKVAEPRIQISPKALPNGRATAQPLNMLTNLVY